MAQLDHGQQTSAIYLLKSAANFGVTEGPGYGIGSTLGLANGTIFPGEPYSCLINDPLHPANVGTIAGDDGVTGLDGFEVRENAANLVEAHGGVHGNFWGGRRPHTLSIETVASSLANREAQLSRLKRCATMFQDGRLFWFPGDPSIVPVTRENKVREPSFEYTGGGSAPQAATGWVNLDAANWSSITFAAAAANATSGSYSLRIKGTKDATATGRNIGAVTATMPVLEGEVYSAKASLFIADAIVSGTGWGIQMKFMDSNGTLVSAVDNTHLAVGATGAQTLTYNGVTVPFGATQCQLLIYANSTTASDTVDAYLDAVQFVQESTAGSYFDGDTANCSWLGEERNAPSVNRPNGKMVTTRLQQPIRIAGGWKKTSFLGMVAAYPFIESSWQHSIGPRVHDSAVAVENRGNRAATPDCIQLIGPAVNPQVWVTQGGVSRIIRVNTTLAGGDVLSIFPKLRIVSLNLTTNLYGSVDFTNTTWWDLMPGIGNSVIYTMTSGGTASSVMYLWYRDCWL